MTWVRSPGPQRPRPCPDVADDLPDGNKEETFDPLAAIFARKVTVLLRAAHTADRIVHRLKRRWYEDGVLTIEVDANPLRGTLQRDDGSGRIIEIDDSAIPHLNEAHAEATGIAQIELLQAVCFLKNLFLLPPLRPLILGYLDETLAEAQAYTRKILVGIHLREGPVAYRGKFTLQSKNGRETLVAFQGQLSDAA